MQYDKNKEMEGRGLLCKFYTRFIHVYELFIPVLELNLRPVMLYNVVVQEPE